MAHLLSLVNKTYDNRFGRVGCQGKKFSESKSLKCTCWGRGPEWRCILGEDRDEVSKEAGGVGGWWHQEVQLLLLEKGTVIIRRVLRWVWELKTDGFSVLRTARSTTWWCVTLNRYCPLPHFCSTAHPVTDTGLSLKHIANSGLKCWILVCFLEHLFLCNLWQTKT